MEFRISQSKLKDWETMCPTEFKAKHITKSFKTKPTIDMEWGNYFETLVIGGGIGGAFSFDRSEHGEVMKRSSYKPRVEQQAADCKAYLKLLGGKKKTLQEYISAYLEDPLTGGIIPIEGTLDVVYTLSSGEVIIIDLKFTGDTDSDFGKFPWGNPEAMDMAQVIHYKLLYKLKYGIDAGTRYWVFDHKPTMKQKLIQVRISEFATNEYILRLAKAYNEILTSIAFDDWGIKNTYANCSKCQAPCPFKRIMPEDYIVEL